MRLSVTQAADNNIFQIRMNTKRVYTLVKELDKDAQILRILIVYNKEEKKTIAYCDLRYPTYPSISSDTLAFMDNDLTNQSFLTIDLVDTSITKEIKMNINEKDTEIWKINKREILPDDLLLDGSYYSVLTDFIYDEEPEKSSKSLDSPPPPSRKMVRDHNYQRVNMHEIKDGILPDFLI